MKKVQNKGFTLVELIFVLVILAILISIIVAVYPGLTHNMKIKTDRASAKNIANAVRSWYVDWDTDSNLSDSLENKLKEEPTGYGLYNHTVAINEISELDGYLDIQKNLPTSLLNSNRVAEPNQRFFIGFVPSGLDVRIVVSVGVGGDEDERIDISGIDSTADSDEIATYDGTEEGIIYIEPKK